MPMARRLRITGRVQGVGYRASLADEARRLGVDGWVRNRHDGSVEAHLQGDPAALDGLTTWARRGPRGARVATVESSAAADESSVGFEIRPTG